jgi:hypothetical protein
MSARALAAILGVLATLAPSCVLADCPTPQVNSILLFSVIRPGGWVALLGANFGPNLNPIIHMVLGNLEEGTPSNVPNTFGVYVPTMYAGDNWVVGWIPEIHGVLEQEASFYVINSCGNYSNMVGAHFMPTMDLKLLPGNRISCTSSDPNDICGGVPAQGGTCRLNAPGLCIPTVTRTRLLDFRVNIGPVGGEAIAEPILIRLL